MLKNVEFNVDSRTNQYYLIKSKKGVKEIQFKLNTDYELYDTNGIKVKKGLYYLNYDNQIGEVINIK